MNVLSCFAVNAQEKERTMQEQQKEINSLREALTNDGRIVISNTSKEAIAGEGSDLI